MLFLSKVEFSTIEELQLKYYYVFLILVSLTFLIRFFETRKMHFIRYFTFALVLIAGFIWYDYFEQSKQKSVFIYNVQDKSYIDIFQGIHCYSNIICSKPSDANVFFNVTPNREYHLVNGVKPLTKLRAVRKVGNSTLFFQNYTAIFILQDIMNFRSQSQIFQIDYLVIGKEAAKFIETIRKNFQFKTLILDAIINIDSASDIENLLGKSIHIHSVCRNGAFEIRI